MLVKQLKEKFIELNSKTIGVVLNDESACIQLGDCIAEFRHLMLLYSCKNEHTFNEYSRIINKANEALARKTRGGNKEVKAIIYANISMLLKKESLIYA